MFNKGFVRMGTTIALSVALLFTLTGPAFAHHPPGNGVPEGCTPGYWKNHTDAWQGFSPQQTVLSAFANAAAFPPSIRNATLLQALAFGGGPGLDGAAQILLRAAVAALLNAAHSDVDYSLTVAQVTAQVNAALASGSRSTMIGLAEQLDLFNNLGCPLN